MRRLHKRWLTLAGVAIVAILGIVAANLKLFKQDSFADTATVTHYNRTTSRNPDMHVGNFQVNHKDAYCVEHDKWSVKEGTRMHSVEGSPMEITESSPSVYKLIYKIVYYGEKLDYGRIPISIAGSYVYTGGRSPQSLTDDDYAEKTKPTSVNAYALYNYASSHPLPAGTKTLTIWHSGNYRYQTLVQYTFEEEVPEPEMQMISVTKNWIDKSNAYGTRPNSVTFKVFVDGTYYTSFTISGSGDSWSRTLAVPMGKITLEEDSVPNGYTSEKNSDTVFTNTYIAKVDTTVTKEWDDFSNRNNTRPTSINMDLLRNGTLLKTVTLTGTGDTWTYTEEGLDEYDDNGNLYIYTWRESSVPNNYAMTQTGNTIVNTLSETVNSTVTKIWSDYSNVPGKRPQTIRLRLLRNGATVKEVDVTGTGDTWIHTETGLDKYDDNGDPYVYSWEEADVPSDYTMTRDGGNTITNTLNGKTSATVTKVWNDNNNAASKRPSSISINLLRNGVLYETVEFSGTGNTWSYSVYDLDKYDPNGHEYAYTWSEISVPKYYVMTQSGNTITNTIDNETSISVTKIWDDNNDADGMRPTSIDLVLYQNDDIYKTVTVTGTGNSWSHTESGLPRFSDDGSTTYNYYWGEPNVPANYKMTQEENVITNTLVSRINLTVSKWWEDDENIYGVRPSSLQVNLLQNGKNYKTVTLTGSDALWTHEEVDLPAYDSEGQPYTYTWKEAVVPDGYTMSQNSNIIRNEIANVTTSMVTKIWDDNNNADGLRPTSISVNLYQNGVKYEVVTLTGTGNTWTRTKENLPKFDDNGEEYVYTWGEPNVPFGYTMTQSGNTITNKSSEKPAGTSTVVKIWKDNSNAGNTRPDMLAMMLYRNGEEYKTVFLTGEEGSDTWTYTETGLEQYDDNGDEYVYTWEEVDSLSDYISSQSGNVITNVLNEKISLTVNKIWDDSSNARGVRPASVTFNILQNGVQYDQVTFNGSGDSWSKTINNLDKYDSNGEPYTYTISEPNVPAGYESSTNGLTITNSMAAAMRRVGGRKIWKDNSNAVSLRPTDITLKLYKTLEGQTTKTEVKNVTATWTKNGNEWNYDFGELPSYEGGLAINYSVEEVVPANYKSSISGFDVTNLLVGTMSIRGTKTWKYKDAPDSVKPASITIVLLRNGARFKTTTATSVGATVNEDEKSAVWYFEFNNLDKYDENGKEYDYTIEEIGVDNFETLVDKYDVTNTYAPDLVNIKVDKIWLNDEEADRPGKIDVTLYRDEVEYKKVELTNDKGWSYEWKNLDSNYSYSVKEDYQIPGYYPGVVKGDVEHGFTIENKKIVENKVDIHVDKIWLNDEEADRPGKIDVTLYRDGEDYDHVELNNQTGWQYDWPDMEADHEYTVEEDFQIPGYYPGVVRGDVEHGFTIENKKIVEETINIHVDKIWLNDNEDDRPGEIDVTLIRDGEVYDEVVLDNETGWEYDWEELEAGHDYKVEETFQIPGYYPGVVRGDVEHGFTIENRKIVENPKTFDGVKAAGIVMTVSAAMGAAVFMRRRRVR